MSLIQSCSAFLLTVVLMCSAQNKNTDVHKKCSQWEEQHCIQGNEKFHYCTAISAEEWKIRLFGPNQSKLFCECREGFSIPVRQAYVNNSAPATDCVLCQEEGTVYYGHNIRVRDTVITRFPGIGFPGTFESLVPEYLGFYRPVLMRSLNQKYNTLICILYARLH